MTREEILEKMKGEVIESKRKAEQDRIRKEKTQEKEKEEEERVKEEFRARREFERRELELYQQRFSDFCREAWGIWDGKGSIAERDEGIKALGKRFDNEIIRDLKDVYEPIEIFKRYRFVSAADEFLGFTNPERREEARRRFHQNKKHEGVVESVVAKKTSGNPYKIIHVGGQKYYDWDPDESAQIGKGIFFSFHEDDKGRLIIDDIIRDPDYDPIPERFLRYREGSADQTPDKQSSTILDDSSAPSQPGSSVPSKIENQEDHILTRDEKLEFRIHEEGALIAERGLSFGLWNLRDPGNVVFKIISGEIDDAVCLIHLVLCRVIYEQYLDDVRPKFTPEEVESLGEMVKGMTPDDARYYSFRFPITVSDIRCILGLPTLSVQRIRRMVEKYAGVVLKVSDFQGMIEVQPNGDETWRRYSSSICQLAMVRVGTQAKRKRGRGHLEDFEDLYEFVLNSPVGLTTVHNVVNGGFDLFPIHRYTGLREGARTIFRSIHWNPTTWITLEQAGRLLKWKVPFTDRRREKDFQRYFESLMDELKKEGFVASWSREYLKKDDRTKDSPRGKYVIERSPKYLESGSN